MSSTELTMSPRRTRATWIRTVVILALVGGAGWTGYRLFEPMLVWSSGWHAVPPMSAAPVQSALDPAWQALAPKLNEWLHEAQRGTEAPAISAAISMNGTRVWAAAIGYADAEAGTPVTLDSSFRLGSSSKAVTSVAIGTLLDRGRLDLDRPLRAYLPDLGEPLASITTRQAMSHTGGVRNYSWCACFPIWEHLNRRHYAGPVRETLRVFETDPLLFPPGTDFAYSSFGYNAAGAVLEASSGTPFLDYLRSEVFTPLGMAHSGGDLAGAATPGRVGDYDVQEGRYKRAFAVDNSNKWPSGGLLSTPSDMLRLGDAMLRPSLFSAATRDRLLTPQPLADGRKNPQGYALGWRYSDEKRLFGDRLTTRIFSHHGTAVGSTSYFAAYPEFGLVVSVMMNKGQENVDALAPRANALVELFLADAVAGRLTSPDTRP